MSRWHDDMYDHIHGCRFGQRPCTWDDCGDAHLHAFTDAELRARDERIIRTVALWHIGAHFHMSDRAIDAIIAAAEAEQ